MKELGGLIKRRVKRRGRRWGVRRGEGGGGGGGGDGARGGAKISLPLLGGVALRPQLEVTF